MLLGKFTRFIKRYDLTLTPRHKAAVALNVVDDPKMPSVLKALHRAISKGTATDLAANGDEVELIKAVHDAKRKVIILLFHRVSPNAADPMYRKKLADKSVSVRKADKLPGEDQSHSAHFIISTVKEANKTYKSVLEEVPGISIGAVQPIISRSLQDYSYDYLDKKDNVGQTYTVVKAAGVKSQLLSDAMKKRQLSFITLVRPGDSKIVDGDGLFEPIDQRMRVKITGVVSGKSFADRVEGFIKRAKEAGWEQFNVDLSLDGDRKRTVKLERDEEAKNVLFVQAEEVSVSNELPLCSTEIIDEIVDVAVKVLRKK